MARYEFVHPIKDEGVETPIGLFDLINHGDVLAFHSPDTYTAAMKDANVTINGVDYRVSATANPHDTLHDDGTPCYHPKPVEPGAWVINRESLYMSRADSFSMREGTPAAVSKVLATLAAFAWDYMTPERVNAGTVRALQYRAYSQESTIDRLTGELGIERDKLTAIVGKLTLAARPVTVRS